MENIHVLLVEDNQDNQELMKLLLERVGYIVTTADNGLEALSIMHRERPDIVLMDLSMPEMDGWSAAREIKKDPELADIPLVAVTAHTLPGDRRRVLGIGFDGYISKPIDVPSFESTIAMVLEKKYPPEG